LRERQHRRATLAVPVGAPRVRLAHP
jgi:hypothetical protein